MEVNKFLSRRTCNTIDCPFWVPTSHFKPWFNQESNRNDLKFTHINQQSITLNGLIKNNANTITIERSTANNTTKNIKLHSCKWEKIANRLKV